MKLRRPDVPTDAILRLYREGKSIDEIAAALGCHRQTAYKRLRKAGEPMRVRGRKCAPIADLVRRWAAGERVPDIANDLGITDHAVYIRLRRHGRPDRPDPRAGRDGPC